MGEIGKVGRTAPTGGKLRLHGFNNLSKHLSISLYQVRYSPEPGPFLEYVDGRFGAPCLALLLEELARRVDARILDLSTQDYDPHGASATALVAEERTGQDEAAPYPPPARAEHRACVAHLDKSHIAIHTYPEGHPDNGIRTLRLDLDLGTCGERSPLHALAPLLDWSDCDLLTLDYRGRGFARDRSGRKLFDDGTLPRVTDFLPASRTAAYEVRERRLPEENLLLVRMKARDANDHPDRARHLTTGLGKAERVRAQALVHREIDELFGGRPQPGSALPPGENQP